MGTKRRIEIRIQTHQVLKINRPGQVTIAWCAACNQQVEMIALERASDLNSQKLHINRLDDDRLLVCLRSMME